MQVNALKAHYNLNNPSKALVLSFHGVTGSGKTPSYPLPGLLNRYEFSDWKKVKTLFPSLLPKACFKRALKASSISISRQQEIFRTTNNSVTTKYVEKLIWSWIEMNPNELFFLRFFFLVDTTYKHNWRNREEMRSQSVYFRWNGQATNRSHGHNQAIYWLCQRNRWYWFPT